MTALPFSCCLLAVLPEYPALPQSIVFQLNGLMVVFLALSSIWILLEITGSYFRRSAARADAAAALSAPVTPAPEDSAPAEGVSFTTQAVIAAAVHVTFQGRARVVAIGAVEPDPSWAREGRRAIFSSHRPR